MKKYLSLLVVALSFSSCHEQIGGEAVEPPIIIGPVVQGDNMAMGNPSKATADIVNANNYLMIKPQYVLSYNNSTHLCNWVSWHLNKAWLGEIGRQEDFRADVDLPSVWFAVQNYSFSGSGFERGHMCPSADRTATLADNSATFLMTNMVPQAPNNNQIPWANFEMYCRSLAEKGYELYIVSGPQGKGGTGRNGYTETLGSNGIVVPQYTWKVVLAIYNGNDDLKRVSETTRTIGIWMPNTQDASSKSWSAYRVSVDFIEAKTGFDFFSNVPENIQKVIEARVDAEN